MQNITVSALLKTYLGSIVLTWVLTLAETGLWAITPLLIGFAIDGLLEGSDTALIQLSAALAGLILVSVIRRLYDTRVYGRIRVETGMSLAEQNNTDDTSVMSARLGMVHELVYFLEMQVPTLMTSLVQVIVALGVLFAFHPTLAYTALVAGVIMIAIYSLFHKRFYNLNADINSETEKQVDVLANKSKPALLKHLSALKKFEVRLSDTEAIVYGAIFVFLLAVIVFNLRFAALNMETTVGTIFSIVSYSWEFVGAALVLPMTLQGWSRLSEIMARINEDQDPVATNSDSAL